MLQSRNMSAHDYGLELSADIADKISNRYCKELTALKKYIADSLK